MIQTAKGRYRRARKDEIISAALQCAVRDMPARIGRTPKALIQSLVPLIGAREREGFYCAWLTVRHDLIAFDEFSLGTLDGAAVYPREIAKQALEHNAGAVVFCHNHPSGHLGPSGPDKVITDRLQEALALFGIRVLDHFIVTETGYYSFAEHQLLRAPAQSQG
jgi:DNA repair protein RadC